jgi:diguanylate cyclase (GGDEF)-like protein/PAS domain S-box-containing protein
MTSSEPLIPIIRAITALAALLAWYEFGRHRGSLRRNIALLATTMVGMVWYSTTRLIEVPFWLHAIGILSFGVHPYLLIRLIHRFRSIPILFQQITFFGAIYALVVVLATITTPLPAQATTIVWIYFVLSETILCTLALISAQRQHSMIRWRFRLVAFGATLFNVLLFILVSTRLLPVLWVSTVQLAFIPLLIVAVFVAFWTGLRPPHWLRQGWIMTEAHGFFAKIVAPSLRQKVTGLSDVLLHAAEKSVDGHPVLALWQEPRESYQLYSRLPNTPTNTLLLAPPHQEVWYAGKAVYIETLKSDWDPHFLRLAQHVHATSAYVVPLATPNRQYGVLFFFLNTKPYFPTDELNLLTLLCEQSASVLEIHQLMESQHSLVQNLHIHSQRSQRLNKIMEAISHASLDHNAILIATTRELSEQIGDGCAIHLIKEGQPEMDLAATFHTNPAKRSEIHHRIAAIPARFDEGIPATILKSQKPFILNYATIHEGVQDAFASYLPLIQQLNIHSSLHLPLTTGGQVLGLLNLFRDTTHHPYSYDELRVVETIADRVALALENATLFQKVQSELEERSRAEKALRESESRFASILSMAPDAIISIDNYQRIINFNRGAEQIFGYEAKEVLGQPLQFLFSEDSQHQKDILRRIHFAATDALKSMPPQTDPTLYWRRNNGSLFPGEVTLSRLKLGGRMIRTLMLRDVTHRLRIEQETRKKTQILATMYATTLTLMDRMHVSDSLETILRRAGQLLETEDGYVALRSSDGNGMEIRIGVGEFANSIGYPVQKGVGLSGTVWESGELLHIKDYTLWEHRAAPPVEGIRATIGIPLLAEHEVVGILALAHFDPTHHFDEEDVELLNLSAPLASIALYNAQLFAEVERLAKTDDLTGLLNRRAFFERAAVAFRQARQSKQPLAAIMVDIDHFKRVNDTFGHTQGDEVLRWIGRECQKLLRSPDVLARYGGEEFALLLPNTTQEAAQRLAEQIRTHIAYHPIEMDRQSLRISLSLGVAAISTDMKDVNDLLNLADSRLYGAKAQGRNQVVGAGYPHPTYAR